MLSKNNNTRLTLRYDGKAFNSHSMDAEKVANAIRGMASSVKQANKILNGENSEIEVKVVAFQDGCFGTVLDFLQTDVSSVNTLATMGLIAGTAAVAGTKSGVLKCIETFAGRKIESEANINDSSETTFILEDGSEVKVESNIAKLIKDKSIRDGLSNVFYEPLEQQGAESVTVGITNVNKNAAEIQEQVTISAQEREKFKSPRTLLAKVRAEEEITKEVYFTKINFNGPRGWKARFPDGLERTVRMDDKQFLTRVKQNEENFSSKMLFVVKFHYSHSSTIEKSTEKYVAKNVLRQRTSSGSNKFTE